MRWSRYNVWEDWDEREKEIERDVFRKRTGKVKKTEILYQGKKGAQNLGEEGKYRSTTTTTTATGLAAV